MRNPSTHPTPSPEDAAVGSVTSEPPPPPPPDPAHLDPCVNDAADDGENYGSITDDGTNGIYS